MEKETKKKIKIRGPKTGFFPIAPWSQFRTLVIFCLVFFLILVAFHIYLFNRFESHNLFGGSGATSQTTPVVNQSKLDGVLKRFAEKEARREEAGVAIPVSDPSR